MTSYARSIASHRSEAEAIAAAQRGDEDAFSGLTLPYRRELHVHCYRMLGSLDDADDAVQDTFLRACRHLDTFEPNAPIRAWLYRIATNACLTALTRRSRKNEVSASMLQWSTTRTAGRDLDTMRLDPYPDHMLDELAKSGPGPEATAELQESIELAFVSAAQLLPGRQRAVLLLRDAMGYPATDVADMLAVSVASVNSALQRARVSMKRHRAAGIVTRDHATSSVTTERELVRRLVKAWESADIDALVATLTEDAVLSMPPIPDRYVGRASIGAFLSTVPGGGRLDRFRLVPTRANRQPAVAAYFRNADDGPLTAHGIVVLAIDPGGIASLVRFANPELFSRFGLPLTLDVRETETP